MTRQLAALVLGVAVIAAGCGSGDDDDAGGALGVCNGFGRIGDADGCTVHLICAKGKYELVCAPTEGGTDVTSCECRQAEQPGKVVAWDPAFCEDQGTQEHGPWLKSLGRRADSACGWNARILD